MTERLSFIPYPPIEKHGVIGDRRTAALVAADGTLSWLCLPDYDGAIVFGALLDAERGGFWRFGPAVPITGHQRYLDNSAALVTTWATDTWELELTDVMAWPQDDRPPESEERRVIVRRLRCLRGETACVMQVYPRHDFDQAATVTSKSRGERTLNLWTSFPSTVNDTGTDASLDLRKGDEVWAVLALNEESETWTVGGAQSALNTTVAYWHDWQSTLTYTGPRAERIRRSALTFHLLSYAPTGSQVAAPTTSLPERIGGDRNYDYRFAWVRDASLSLSSLSLLGKTESAQRYLDWLVGLDSSTDAPLQVLYRIDGGTDLTQHERSDIAGYRGSLPVRTGNHASSQFQIDSFGYLANCTLIYLSEGGEWKSEYWEMLRRIADYTVANWQKPDSGIWEVSNEEHYVSSKVMSWVILDRAVKVATKLGHTDETDNWRLTAEIIHAEVMERGWSEQLKAFSQYYGSDTLDAAALLIPIVGFLPADHPRVLATVDRIAASLTIDGFVHRSRSIEPGQDSLPLGEFEGAFLPCTFWLATVYAKIGRPDEAEAILVQAEAIAGDLGLFAEEVDARNKTFLGNTPLLFSHAEYIRAVLELAKARPLDKARTMVGEIKQQISQFLDPKKSSQQM